MINPIIKVNMMGNQKYLVLAFSSRNYLYSFQGTLTSYGIATSVINTPRNIATSCGLSLKADFRFLASLKGILNHTKPTGLIGMYVVDYNFGQENITKI